ncbi:acyl-homoserine-lactone synthase [Aquabacter cavernae]|uniref:acyl-homoserine-lactone synthase n=1 Tax=Aquabacter cavernae TaxID=2496029 RepID=UPI000F8F2773|nr:acyl-homoserine-lactone synthase [Aquabacter cavernae]
MLAGRLRGRIFFAADDDRLCREVQVFRRRMFVDELGWDLTVHDGREHDEFDRNDAILFALQRHDAVVGCFRALRCDRPYLSREVFPGLASDVSYPSTSDCWEISRLAVSDRSAGAPLYAAMLDFGWKRRARALVALVDLSHERMLRAMQIHTRRYGAPAVVGINRSGRQIDAVAGEIPLDEQSPVLHRAVSQILAHMEISDETLVLGPDRVSA